MGFLQIKFKFLKMITNKKKNLSDSAENLMLLIA